VLREDTGLTDPPLFPAADHDHRHCARAILAHAEGVCRACGARLTPQRKRVLEIVASSHAAIGAYAIMDRLKDDGRPPAPIAVYRALDFLIANGLVHRIASRHAYVACTRAGDHHGSQFLICRRCGAVGEMTSAAIWQALIGAAAGAGFSVVAPVIEVEGECAACHAEANAAAPDTAAGA
jgi:Fur family zinc uptake transcriptional regulator